MNLSVKQKETHGYRDQTYYGQGKGERSNWEFGISRGKLLYIEQVNNKFLLYNTGNYNQYLVINSHGKENDKEGINTYV